MNSEEKKQSIIGIYPNCAFVSLFKFGQPRYVNAVYYWQRHADSFNSAPSVLQCHTSAQRVGRKIQAESITPTLAVSKNAIT